LIGEDCAVAQDSVTAVVNWQRVFIVARRFHPGATPSPAPGRPQLERGRERGRIHFFNFRLRLSFAINALHSKQSPRLLLARNSSMAASFIDPESQIAN
jgi:hypothetical protein